jgi:hypothetical protein
MVKADKDNSSKEKPMLSQIGISEAFDYLCGDLFSLKESPLSGYTGKGVYV